MENEQRFFVPVVAQGTRSWPVWIGPYTVFIIKTAVSLPSAFSSKKQSNVLHHFRIQDHIPKSVRGNLKDIRNVNPVLPVGSQQKCQH